MNKSLCKKSSPKILLIGASRGIGLAMTEAFLKRCWQVTATVRNMENTELKVLSREYGSRLSVQPLDMTDTDALQNLHSKLSGQTFDVLFVNAGTSNRNQNETVADVSTEEFVHVMVTNALAPMRAIEIFRDLVVCDGLIGIMSSGQGSITNNVKGGKEVYRGSKSALNQYMRSFAAREADLCPQRSLLLLAPGWIRTDLGGEDAAFTLEETIPDMVNVITSKKDKPGLDYLDRFGKTVPW